MSQTSRTKKLAQDVKKVWTREAGFKYGVVLEVLTLGTPLKTSAT